jgi:hypothetical protein
MGETNLITQANAEAEKAEWFRWADYHRTLFGWHNDADGKMVGTWIGFFRRYGFTAEEMMAATDGVARQEIPPFSHEKHLNALEQHALMFRREKMKRTAYQVAEERGVCTDCLNSGLISVPWLPDVVDGVWCSSRTAAVWCRCPDGRVYAGVKDGRDRALMGSTEYFARNPKWRMQVKARAETAVEKALLVEDITIQLQSAAQQPRNVLDNLISRMSVRYGLLPGDEPTKIDTASVAWSEGSITRDWKEGDLV